MADEPLGQVPTDDAGAQTIVPEPEAQGAEEDVVARLKGEAAKYRRQLRDLEAKVQSEQDGKLGETERLTKKLAQYESTVNDLERTLQDLRLQHGVTSVASKLGIIDPDAAYKLLDLTEVEFDEAGNPTKDSLEGALKRLVKERPYLSQRASVVAAGAGSPAKSEDMNDLIRRAAGIRT